jgi:hypothetical protein
MRASCPHLLLVLTGLLVTGVAHAAAPPGGLTGLERVAVRVEGTADVATLSAELQQRIADALRQPPRGVHIDPASPDVLRLTVGIRSLSSTTLRGFNLPFSGTYGVGPVRLALQRRVVVGGVSDVLATVWEDERQAAGPWRGVAAQARRLTDELVDAFLAAYRAIDPRRGERRRSPDLPNRLTAAARIGSCAGEAHNRTARPLGSSQTAS